MWKLNEIIYRCSINLGSYPSLSKAVPGQLVPSQLAIHLLLWLWEASGQVMLGFPEHRKVLTLVQRRHWLPWNFCQNQQSFIRMGWDRQEGAGMVLTPSHPHHQQCLGFWDWVQGLQQQGVDVGNANPRAGKRGQKRSVFPVLPGQQSLRFPLSLSGL